MLKMRFWSIYECFLYNTISRTPVRPFERTPERLAKRSFGGLMPRS